MEHAPIPDTMQVACFEGKGTINRVAKPVPLPGPGELLIRVRANALCGSERGQWLQGAERTPGHEIAGTVASVGTSTNTPVGTPGVIFLMVYCGECRSCVRGFTNQCLAKQGDIGFNRDGGYAPYVLVPEQIFFPVDPDISLAEATLLLDIMGTGGHAIARAQRVHSDIQSIAIAGAGPMGLGVLAMAKLRLGRELPVMVADVNPFRLELAARLGALTTDLRHQTMEAGLAEHGLEKVDLAVDTSGKTDARQACLGILAQRGVLVMCRSR